MQDLRLKASHMPLHGYSVVILQSIYMTLFSFINGYRGYNPRCIIHAHFALHCFYATFIRKDVLCKIGDKSPGVAIRRVILQVTSITWIWFHGSSEE